MGALLISNERLTSVSDFICSKHFFEPVHQRLYDAIKKFYDLGEVANPITLKNHFDQDGALAGIGGAKYLVALVAGSSTFIDLSSYARKIYKLWQSRKLVEWVDQAKLRLLEDADAHPDVVAASLVGNINDMASVDKRRQVVRGDKASTLVMDDLKNADEAFSTGIPLLDEAMCGGLYPSYTYGFMARKKVGKTVMGGTLSYNLDAQGVDHLFICGEMGFKQIAQRMMARHAEIYPSSFVKKEYQNDRFYHGTADYMMKMGKHIHWQDAPGLTFDDLKQYMSRAVYKLKVKGVILDYWQLVGGRKNGVSEASHLDEVAQWIANFCRQHKIWSILFAQVNQEGNTRGGEGLRNACDQLYQIHRPDHTMPPTWLQMVETRYTPSIDIGDEHNPGLWMEPKGPYFRQVDDSPTSEKFYSAYKD